MYMRYDKKTLIHFMQLITSVLVALEVSIPPNPYKEELILSLIILICLKHDIPEKIINTIEKYTK